MGEIVYIQNDRVVTDSLTIAEVFGKDHDKVVRDIKNQISKLIEAGQEHFSTANFGESDYTNERGKTYKKYILTEKAFTLVTMAYNTIEAMNFKVRYIEEFERMKNMIGMKNTRIPSSFSEALRLAADLQEQNEKLEAEKLILLPKAKERDQIADGKNKVGIKKAGLNIGIGEKKFFEFLRSVKVLYKQGNDNLPYVQYVNKQYFDLIVIPKEDEEGNTFNQYITKVTGKGELYILNIVNKYGGAEKINGLKLKEINNYVDNYKFN